MSRRQSGSRDRATLALIGLSVLAGALISGRALGGRSRPGVAKLDAGKVKDRGRLAQRPAEIPPRGLRDVFWRVKIRYRPTGLHWSRQALPSTCSSPFFPG